MHEDKALGATPAAIYATELTEAQHKAIQEVNALTARRNALLVEAAVLEERLALLAQRNREVLAPMEAALWDAIKATRAATVARQECGGDDDPDWSRVEDLAVAGADWILTYSEDAATSLDAVRAYVASVTDVLRVTDLEVVGRAYALLAARDAELAQSAATLPDM